MTNSQSPIKHTLPPRPPSDPKISQRARRQKTSSRESLVSSHSHDIESTVIDKPKRSLNDHDSNNSSSDSLGSWERKDKMEPLRALKKNTSQNSLPPLPKLEIQTSFTSRQPPPNFSPKPAPKHFRSEGHLRSESQSSLGGKSTIGLKSSLSTPRTPPPPSRSPAPPSSRSMSNINTDFKPAPPSFSPAPSPHTRSGSYSFGKSTNFIDSNNHFRSKSANSPKKSNLKIDIHSKITDLPMTTSPTTYESPYSSPQSPMRSPRLQSKKKLGKKDSHLQSQSLGYASSISQLNDSQDESKALEKARRRLKKNLVKREESLSPKRSNTPEVQLEPLKNDTEDENELNAQQEEIKEEDVVLNDENEPTAADLLFKKFNKRVIDFVNDIMCVTIHSADALRPSLKILHPIIMVHIIDSITGKYISKTDPTRPVTTFYETDNLDHILPQLTRPYSFAKNLTITPKWEQDLVFNDEYLHILKDNVIVFFELLDFATGSKNQHFQYFLLI